MGAYNFKPQFEEPIALDTKRHTIRDRRKHPDKPGSLLSLFVGMRTKKCRLLKRRLCTWVQNIHISVFNTPAGGPFAAVVIEGDMLTASEQNAFAKSDGFPDFNTFMEFWKGRLPFDGDLIHWESNSEYARRIGAPWEVISGETVLCCAKMKLTEADALRRAANARQYYGVRDAAVRPKLPPEISVTRYKIFYRKARR